MGQAPWYYVSADRQRQGPVPAESLPALVAAGTLSARSLVWREGMTQWQPLAEVAGELGLVLPPPPSPPALEPVAEPLPGPRTVPAPDERLQQAYAAQIGADPQANHVVHGDGPVVYAGFLKRLAASAIDGFIVSFGGAIVGGVLGGVLGLALLGAADPFTGSVLLNGISSLMGMAIGLAYYAGFHASSSQATPGKMLIGIKVARGDGERLSLLRACGRFLATYLNLFTLGIGWLIAAFTPRKQALHDFIVDTVVVDRWAYTASPERQNDALGGCAIAVLALLGVALLIGVAAIVMAVVAIQSGGWR